MNSESDEDGIFCGYLSDNKSELEWKDLESDTLPTEAAETENDEPTLLSHPTSSTNVIPPPPRKRQKLDVPACDLRKKAREARYQTLKEGLLDIEKLIASKQTEFDAGRNGLQAYRA
jgi:hypothetical protein